MLEKINAKASDDAQGSSGRRSVLEKHDGVLGVSNHDTVYTNTVVDLSYPEQSPFAGTPQKSSKATPASTLTSKQLNFDNIARDAMPLRPSVKPNQVHNVNLAFASAEERNSAIAPICPNPTSMESSTMPVNECSDLPVIDDFKLIESLTRDGKIEKSLDMLLCMLDSKALKGSLKLLVHRKIASRRLFLGWT